MEKQIQIPEFNGESIGFSSQSYSKIVEGYKANLDKLPELIAAIKKNDNETWAQLLNELEHYLETDPNLSKVIRVKTVDGVEGISIGEPNFWTAAAVGAFSVGYMIGTACYKSGWCKFV